MEAGTHRNSEKSHMRSLRYCLNAIYAFTSGSLNFTRDVTK